MDNLFNSIFQSFNTDDVFSPSTAAFTAAAQLQQQQQQQPPASKKCVRTLPTVAVTREDLADENNRECCICFERNNLGDRVARLPCAHIYHHHCISLWLSKHNTCPVCRYELPTDDPVYERGRIERMKHRKPRYARYELDRMPRSELRDLATRLRIHSGGVVDRRELVSHICESGKIDVIAAPPPVEYRLSVLRIMGIGTLKRAMADAGVFFDAREVVEKEDMVQIFINSGRVLLLKEEYTEKEEEMNHPPEEETDFHKNERQTTTTQDVGNDNDVIRNDDGDGTITTDCGTTAGEPSSSSSEAYLTLSSKSITELKRLARDRRVDISDCIEKKEMVEKLLCAFALTP